MNRQRRLRSTLYLKTPQAFDELQHAEFIFFVCRDTPNRGVSEASCLKQFTGLKCSLRNIACPCSPPPSVCKVRVVQALRAEAIGTVSNQFAVPLAPVLHAAVLTNEFHREAVVLRPVRFYFCIASDILQCATHVHPLLSKRWWRAGPNQLLR